MTKKLLPTAYTLSLSSNIFDRNRSYFVYNRSGEQHFYYFDSIAKAIRKYFPELAGKHIYEQLEALGMSEVFQASESPVTLPYSFSDCK